MASLFRMTLVAAAVGLAVACSSSTSEGGGGGTPPSQLSVLRLATGSPPLCADSVGAWLAKNPGGPELELALLFPKSGQMADCLVGETEDFLRFRLKPDALLRFPDSTLIANGDSVFISVKWVGTDSILFEMKPSGLTFDPSEPAELKIQYDHAGPDLNRDNEVNAEDDAVEQRLDIWRQERPGDSFFRVGTAKVEELKEIEARLFGFSRFAIAY